MGQPCISSILPSALSDQGPKIPLICFPSSCLPTSSKETWGLLLPFGKSNGKDGRIATARLRGPGSESRGESGSPAQWGWGWKGPQSRIQLSMRWSPLKCWVDKNDKQGHQIGSKFKQVPLAGRWIMSYSIPSGRWSIKETK